MSPTNTLDGRTTRHIPDWIVIDEPTRTCECQRCGASIASSASGAAWRVCYRRFFQIHKRCPEVANDD